MDRQTGEDGRMTHRFSKKQQREARRFEKRQAKAARKQALARVRATLHVTENAAGIEWRPHPSD